MGLNSESEAGLGGRTMPCPRGKLVGGSSAVNAMAFVRGHLGDFDQWAEVAGRQWMFERCLPYFRSLETFSGGADRYRGGEGPVHVKAPGYSNPLYREFLLACVQAGYAISKDTNGAVQEGFGPMDQNIHKGLRESSATAFLDPVRKDPNLTLLMDTFVERVRLEDRRAVGVVLRNRSGQEVVAANREVILCAGAIHSPHLLMLSGIGPADQLRNAGVDVLHDAPAVGRNLQDHVDISLREACPEPITESLVLRFDRKILIGLEWILFKTGKGHDQPFRSGRLYRHPGIEAAEHSDLLHALAGFLGWSAVAQSRHGYQISIMLLRPESRGSVDLEKSDPRVPPRLRFGYSTAPTILPSFAKASRQPAGSYHNPRWLPSPPRKSRQEPKSLRTLRSRRGFAVPRNRPITPAALARWGSIRGPPSWIRPASCTASMVCASSIF